MTSNSKYYFSIFIFWDRIHIVIVSKALTNYQNLIANPFGNLAYTYIKQRHISFRLPQDLNKIFCKEAQNEISFGTKHNKLKICHQIWMWYYLQNTNYINIKFTDESLDKCYVVSNNVTRYKIRILVYVISHKYKQ